MLASTAKCGVEFSEPALAAKRAREESGMVPLIIPVSVPVRTVGPAEVSQVGSGDEDGKGLEQYPPEHKPSVIVTRRRSTRVPGTDAPAQVSSPVPGASSYKDSKGSSRCFEYPGRYYFLSLFYVCLSHACNVQENCSCGQ